MELVYFTQEFFRDAMNLVPLLIIVPVAVLLLILMDRRKPLESAFVASLFSSLLSAVLVLGVFLFASGLSSDILANALGDPLLYAGLALTVASACIPVWIFARYWLIRRKQKSLTEAFR